MAANIAIQVDEELLIDLKCPVCLKIPQTTPIYRCCQGHIHCKDCHPRLKNCPVCRSSIGRTRALMVEKVITRLPADCFLEENHDVPKGTSAGSIRKILSNWISNFGTRSNQDRSETHNLFEDQNQFEYQNQFEDQNLPEDIFIYLLCCITFIWVLLLILLAYIGLWLRQLGYKI